LILHRREAAAAARAGLIGSVELEDLFDDGKLRLLCISEFLALLLWLRRQFFELLGDLGRLLRQRLDERQLLLKLVLVSFELRQLVRLRLKDLQQLLDLNLLRERDATKLLDIFLASQVRE
jgi:hypothetical protein